MSSGPHGPILPILPKFKYLKVNTTNKQSCKLMLSIQVVTVAVLMQEGH